MGLRRGRLEDQPLLSRTASMFDYNGYTAGTAKGLPRWNTQAVAHRGFKAQHPENSMEAFEGAVLAGAHGIETDVRLSKDGTVVISHDASLKRCFGVNKNVGDCDLAYLQTLRTLQPPHVHLPTLHELLAFLALPENRRVWLLLDIKLIRETPDVQEAFIRAVAECLRSVDGLEMWMERVVVGCWFPSTVRWIEELLPGFQMAHIGFSIPFARQFLEIPNVNFNLHFSTLTTARGRKFIEDAKEAGRAIYLWTVNDEEVMKWCINLEQLDAVVTDDPEKFLELQRERREMTWETVEWTAQQKMMLWLWLVGTWLVTFILFQHSKKDFERRLIVEGRK